jgi:hypothetical protein
MLLLALLISLVGLALIAATIPRHWRQLRDDTPLSPRLALVLRLGGSLALFVSLLLCLASGHPTMTVLVWIMLLAVGAVLIALLFAAKAP